MTEHPQHAARRNARPAPHDHFVGDSEMAARLREFDWSASPLGEPANWPASLQSTVALMLGSKFPMFVAWGSELTLLYNDAYSRIIGAKHPEALGEPFRETWAEILADIDPLINQTLAGEALWLEDLPLRMNRHGYKEDTTFTFSYSPARDDAGEIAGLFCACTDTTEKTKAEAALRELARTLEAKVDERGAALLLYKNIVQSDQSPVCAFDRDLRLLAFNKAHGDEFVRVYGHRPQVGDILTDYFLPDQAPLVRQHMERALRGEVFTIVEEFGDPDLEKPYWEVSFYPLRDEEGEIIGAFHHAQDITERLRAEAELEATQDALRQSQKMEAVGQLTGGLAHDFNNLLTGIMGNLELLQRRAAQGRLDSVDRFIDAAQAAGRRASALTQRLLAFSRRQTLDPKPTDVNRLIREMEELLRRTVGPLVEIEVVGAVGLWPALIDGGQLENALLNLCINGRDAMPEGGKLTIETANKWIDERAGRERQLPPGQYLSLCVTDTGTGMAPETVSRAFDPFFTTKPIGQGTGLGLSMIYGFARQSGGQVRIYSELGAGTTVCIYLPRHFGEAEEAAPVESAPPAETGRGETVLVVDDEASIRHLIDEVLDEAGYTIIGAADGAAALKVLQSGATIDLLITDVGLPNGMNGRQVADAALALHPELKVLFITGYAENAAVGNGHLEPSMELLTKPFSMEDLARRVQEMLEKQT